MEKSSIRVLLVDDHNTWRHFSLTTLLKEAGLQVIGEAHDGIDAVQKARQLEPDLILLDIGLPKLNGIEAARQIRRIAPKSKILFVSENRSWHIVEEALRSGGDGYVIKADAVTDLLPAVKAVLQGKRFVIGSFAQVEGSSTAQ